MPRRKKNTDTFLMLEFEKDLREEKRNRMNLRILQIKLTHMLHLNSKCFCSALGSFGDFESQ
jgi:hypothetical protein